MEFIFRSPFTTPARLGLSMQIVAFINSSIILYHIPVWPIDLFIVISAYDCVNAVPVQLDSTDHSVHINACRPST